MPRNSTTDVVNIDADERLIREGEKAVSQYEKNVARHKRSSGNARERIMPMAFGLLAARRKYIRNTEYGRWLASSPYNRLDKTDRAALVRLAENEQRARAVLETSTSISPQLLWREVMSIATLSEGGEATAAERQRRQRRTENRLVYALNKMPSRSMTEKLAAAMQDDPSEELEAALRGAIQRLSSYLREPMTHHTTTRRRSPAVAETYQVEA